MYIYIYKYKYNYKYKSNHSLTLRLPNGRGNQEVVERRGVASRGQPCYEENQEKKAQFYSVKIGLKESHVKPFHRGIIQNVYILFIIYYILTH